MQSMEEKQMLKMLASITGRELQFRRFGAQHWRRSETDFAEPMGVSHIVDYRLRPEEDGNEANI